MFAIVGTLDYVFLVDETVESGEIDHDLGNTLGSFERSWTINQVGSIDQHLKFIFDGGGLLENDIVQNVVHL